MQSFQKFEDIDYANSFVKRINSVHQLVLKHLKELVFENMSIIDLGGGPGVGAKLVDAFGKKLRIVNVEPSENAKEVPDLNNIDYQVIQLTFNEVLKYNFPWKADMILMVSAAHEIALSYGNMALKNKEQFIGDLKDFLNKNLKRGGMLCIGFPNYKSVATDEEVSAQRNYTDRLLGHSHPPAEFFSPSEFLDGLKLDLFLSEEKPMILGNETPEETMLMANFVTFKFE